MLPMHWGPDMLNSRGTSWVPTWIGMPCEPAGAPSPEFSRACEFVCVCASDLVLFIQLKKRLFLTHVCMYDHVHNMFIL